MSDTAKDAKSGPDAEKAKGATAKGKVNADDYSPYTGPNEIVPGGQYVQRVTFRDGQPYGGRVVNAHGDVLATFKPNQVNTGNPADGQPPETPGDGEDDE